jgi:M6 family metalloprotease-like protein
VALLGLAFAAVLVLGGRASAVPAAPIESRISQPDGETFEARPWGDEHANGYETRSGHAVVKGGKGVWYYAQRGGDDKLHPTSRRPDRDPPPAASKNARPALAPTAEDAPAASAAAEADAAPAAGRYTGTQNVLTILAAFDDESGSTTASHWSNQWFGATGSVKAFYAQASFDQMLLSPAAETHGTESDGIVGFVNLGYDHPNTKGDGDPRPIAQDAIEAAGPYIDYASFDTDGNGQVAPHELHIVVVLAGSETAYGGSASSCGPSVWGHNWGLEVPPIVDGTAVGVSYSMFGERHCRLVDPPGHPATIGIMAHEFGHDIGWPDLYDVDGGSQGIGAWSVMAGGAWLDKLGDSFAGQTPSLPDAFLKAYQGWITPTQITGTRDGVSIGAASSTPQALQLLDNPDGVDWSFYEHSGAGEYFLVENRQKQGFDAGLPGCGLLVWHVDETRTSTNEANADQDRRLVDLEEADGLNDLAPYGAGVDRTFNDTSDPNSKLYGGASSGVSMTVTSTSCSSSMLANFTTPGGDPSGGDPPFTPSHLVSVTKVGRGRVTSGESVPTISCGSDCSETYTQSTVVRLTARPRPGYRFARWGAGPCASFGRRACVLSVNGPMTIKAVFRRR